MNFDMLLEFPNVLILAFILFLVIAIILVVIYSKKVKNENSKEFEDVYEEDEETVEFINNLLDEGDSPIEITDEEIKEYETTEIIPEDGVELEEKIEAKEEPFEFVPLEEEQEENIIAPIKEVKLEQNDDQEENIETL